MGKYEKQEKNFGTYYKTHFGKTLDTISANYILLSENGCHGCIEGMLNNLIADEKSIIIMSERTYKVYASEHLDTKNILVDSTGDINRLVYTNDNIGIIQMSGGHITNIINPEINNVGQAIEKLKK